MGLLKSTIMPVIKLSLFYLYYRFGSVATLVEKGKIDTANCPGLYPRNKKCHWLIEAPAEYAVKVIKEKLHLNLCTENHSGE